MVDWLRKWLGIVDDTQLQQRVDELHKDRASAARDIAELEERLKVTEAYSAELANRILILERAQADAKQAPRAQTMTGIRRSIGQMGGLKDEVLTR